MKRQKTYHSFIGEDLDLVKDAFTEYGYSIQTEEDVSTYDGWKDKNRRVKRGEKAVKVVGSKPLSQPRYRNGYPIINEDGTKAFAKFPPTFFLFAKEQTECLTKKQSIL